jgi:tetratricopeptide (TPR) repeat protein
MVQLFVPGRKDDVKEHIKEFEEKLSQFKSKMAENNISDESLSMFINQLEKELEKLKSGDKDAGKRASSLVGTIEQRLSELSSEDALAELRTKIKKPVIEGAEEVKPELEQALEQPMVVQEETPAAMPAEEAKPAEQAEAPKEQPPEEKPAEEKPPEEKPAEPVKVESVEAPEAPEKPPEQLVVQEAPAEKKETFIEEKTVPEQPEPKPSFEVVKFNKDKAEKLFQNSIDLILKAQLDSGGIPISIGLGRLHYIYPRAHLLATLGLVYAGKFEEAKKALQFAFKGQNRHTGALPQRWDYNANDASYRKVECDCTALFLYTFAEYVKKSSDYEFAEHHWERIEKAVDFINSKIVPGKNLVLTPNSIHEYAPIDYGYEIWCNAICCAALRELSHIAEKIRLQYPPLEKENLIKEAIMSYMWNSRINTFIKTIKVEDATGVILGPDASVLALAFFNVFNDNDDRIKSTVEFIEKGLKYEPLGGIMDYPEQYGREYTGLGANPFFTLILADHYICLKNKEMAQEHLRWVLSVATEDKLPKYIATKDDFEALVSDLNDAGLLDRETLMLIESTRKHADYANGIAHILEPYLPAHGIFLIVWSKYKETFK